MEYSYKFRIYPNSEQESLIQRTFGCVRFVYNNYLALRIEAYKEHGETMNYVACSNNMTLLKKKLEWLREVDATALQSSLRDLDTAFQNFFRGVKRGKHVGYPKFKSKRDNRKSYKSKRTGMSIRVLDNKHIQLPKLGSVRCAVSKRVRGRILSATVSQAPSGKFYAESVCHDMSCFDCWDWWLGEEAKNPARNVIKDDLIPNEPVPDSAWTDKIPDGVMHGSFGSFKNPVSK